MTPPSTPSLSAWRGPRRWPARALNGAGVALGVGLIQGLGALAFGPTAGLLMGGGAVCASLPDTPQAPQRTWRRVLPAALLVSGVTLAAVLLRAQVGSMALLIAAVTLLTQLAMAWGLRAGALGFSATMALVFALAGQPAGSLAAAAGHAGWTLLGALTYAGWAQASSLLLRRRYRELAVAQALRAVAARLRSRGQRIAQPLLMDPQVLQASIRDDVTLADSLQAARDLVFAASPSVHSRRLTDLVLQLIELRDLLLASRLDLSLLGDDAASQAWRHALAQALDAPARALDGLADAVTGRGPLPTLDAAALQQRLQQALAQVRAAGDDPRLPLVHTVSHRLALLAEDTVAMLTRAGAPDQPARMGTAELRHFVSPEGWPLAALAPHLTLQSPVMRHALRAALATTTAWLLAQVLPWAAHPYWLVLSVAVVLRGNLEQTLARRNQRVAGTVLGCVLAAGLTALHQPGWLPLVFLAAVGTAHAYVNHRYVVTATAATLMALLQPVMLLPGSHLAVGERLADTAIGALLAWAACFVLPSWERRTLHRQLDRLQQALARHAQAVMSWPTDAAAQLRQRQGRALAYAALGDLAAAAQRGRAEPRWARLPPALFEAVLSHGYTLMALLGTVQHTLARQAGRLDADAARRALATADERCSQALAGAPHATPAPQAVDLADAVHDDETSPWPSRDGTAALTPWLLRRLRLSVAEAQALGEAARHLRAEAGNPRQMRVDAASRT